LEIRDTSDWQQMIQNLPLVTLKRLGNGVDNSFGNHVEVCVKFANDLVDENEMLAVKTKPGKKASPPKKDTPKVVASSKAPKTSKSKSTATVSKANTSK